MMRIDDLLRLSTRMFKTRPMRTWLTILGVGVGIAAIFFLVTLGYGMQRVLLEQITTSESLLSLDVHPSESGVLPLTSDQLKAFADLPDVAEVSPVANLPAQVSLNNFTGDAMGNIVKPSFFRLSGTSPMTGEFFKEEDSGQVVITSTVLKLLNIKADEAIGQKLKVTFFVDTQDNEESQGTDPTKIIEYQREFAVVGVVENELSSIVYIDYDDIPSDVVITNFAQAKVRVASSEVLDSVRQQIKEDGFTVFALSDTIAEANKIFNAIQMVLALFGIVALLVAAIGMFNTVTIALLERTQEIGIMKAIGAASSDILIMFLTESALMGFLGGLSGIFLGYIGGEIINVALNLLATRLGSQPLDLFLRPTWFVVTIIIFSTVIGLLTGILPARRAAKLNTLEALRYK